jgi:hypothetical protein
VIRYDRKALWRQRSPIPLRAIADQLYRCGIESEIRDSHALITIHARIAAKAAIIKGFVSL